MTRPSNDSAWRCASIRISNPHAPRSFNSGQLDEQSGWMDEGPTDLVDRPLRGDRPGGRARRVAGRGYGGEPPRLDQLEAPSRRGLRGAAASPRVDLMAAPLPGGGRAPFRPRLPGHVDRGLDQP